MIEIKYIIKCLLLLITAILIAASIVYTTFTPKVEYNNKFNGTEQWKKDHDYKPWDK